MRKIWVVLLLLLCWTCFVGSAGAVNDEKASWLKNGRLTRPAKDLIEILDSSWMQGLNPETYHIDEIKALSKGKDPARLESLLMDGYIHYVRDMSGMRIRARDMGLDPQEWRQPMSVEEAVSQLAAHGRDIKDFLEGLEPQGATYQSLKAELVNLLKQKSTDDPEPKPLKFKTAIKPGEGANDIPELRARFKTNPVPEHEQYRYDDDLAAAVMAFQKENDLKSDGVIGKDTLRALNRTRFSKIRQVIVNMERLRWVNEQKPPRFIIVNIPSATLWAVENGMVSTEMPVIVGRTKRPTASFVAQISGVRFNPTWTVPPTIKKQDILPQLIEDPLYLQDKGIELYKTQDGIKQTIDPTLVDWELMTPNDLGALRMVQTAGDHNPLGRIRVLMPNRFDIYLHDTNHPELFSRADRAQSSGCVRMQRPEDIARFILKNIDGWSDQKMVDILKSGKTKDYYIQEKMPVYIVYYTAWIGENGKIVYGNDLYDYDKKLWELIENK